MTQPSPVLLADDVTKAYAGRTVLGGIDLRAHPGHRIGLIGENGAGKSTLVRLLAGVETPDSGVVRRPPELAYLAQEPALRGTVAGVLAEALTPLHLAVQEVERLSTRFAVDPVAASDYARALEHAQAHDAWDADRRTEVAAARLGIADIAPDRRVEHLSGGERTRLALTTIIATRPGCVIMDEPTNHLDDQAMELLEEFLIGLPGIVIAASHDRVFLDRVCTAILDLDQTAFGSDGGRRDSPAGRRQSVSSGGGFTHYLAGRTAERQRWEQRFALEQEQIARLRQAAQIDTTRIAPGRGPRDNDKFIFAFKGSRVDRALAHRVRDAQRRLMIAERDQLPQPPAPLVFRSPLTADTAAHPDDADATEAEAAIQVRDLQVPGRVSVPLLEVPTGGRLLLTGTNGSGKSSLLMVLSGRLRPLRGTVRVTAQRVGMLDQDVDFDDPAASAGSTFGRAAGTERAALLLELGLLRPREIASPVGILSVGQRRRLALAILIAGEPDLMLLDEPTNHLSLTLAAELTEALRSTGGTVIVASHDRWLRRNWDGPEIQLPPATRGY